MKWFIAIVVLFGLVLAASSLYEAGHDTAMAALIFFVILPYVGIIVAKFVENDELSN